MAKIDPPWWFDPRLIPQKVFWGGAFVLFQFFAQKGEIKCTPKVSGTKIVFERNENTPNGYEGVFLLSVGGFPKVDENSGIAGPFVSFNLKGLPDDITPPSDFCGATTIDINYERYLTHFPIGYVPEQTQVWERKTTGITDPNGYREWIDDHQIAVPKEDVNNVPQSEHVTSHSIWYFSDTQHKYFDTHQPCATYNPTPPKVTFSCAAWIFPHAKHKLYSADKYFPIRKDGSNDWSDSYIWEMKSNDNNLEDGDYDFIIQRRKFRAFDLPTDHDDDLPPLKEPFTAEDVEKREKENKKRFDAKHMMLELWCEKFTYRVSRFRYPVVRPKATKPGEKPPEPAPSPAVFDDEWSDKPGGINGPPPILQTQG